jgi:polyphosphate kinase
VSAANVKSFGNLLDRELSLLEFQSRVLAEGMEPGNPPLERLKFLGIVSSNIDEFFMNRFPRLDPKAAGTEAVRVAARVLARRQSSYFKQTLLPELEAAGISRVLPSGLDEKQTAYLDKFFAAELFPILTPIALGPEREVPNLNNLGLHLVAALSRPGDKAPKYALIEIPQNLPRMIALPAQSGYRFMLIEDVVRMNVRSLFGGCALSATGLMRPTRAAVMPIDEERDEDFMKVMSDAVKARRRNPIIRLEIAAPEAMTDFLRQRLELEEAEICPIEDWLDLKSISQLAFQSGFETLKRPVWEPVAVAALEKSGGDLFSLLRERDLLVHHPYESFDVVSGFIKQAADDPDVLAIKQTLYRAGRQSAIVAALERAAESGKRVTALVELKARFDEENNIEWAKRLEAAGATVIYGVAGLKTHGKASLVVRREPDGIRRYAHLSTGNYNEKTARLYSDIGFFTSKDEYAGDISAFFNMITGYSEPANWARIETAPHGLRRRLLRLIAREALTSTKARPGLIMAKMNSLVDPEIIAALYAASKQGVVIKLNVRGICCLRPGVKDLSESIEVVSIVDMFLEHARIFYFANNGEEEVYLSSADWMPRNLDRRVELMFPVEGKDEKRELADLLKDYFKDNEKAWRLESDGTYRKLSPDKKKFRVQEQLCRQALERRKLLEKAPPMRIEPRTAPKA